MRQEQKHKTVLITGIRGQDGMYLAELLHVDPFDQPNVEDYKKVMRDILNSQTH